MERYRYFLIVFLLSAIFTCSYTAQAAENTEYVKREQKNTDAGNADDWFTKPKESGRIINQTPKEKENTDNKEKERYIFLLEDNGFAYFLDSQNARWITIPYSKSEDILDVWIRLTKLDEDGEYSYPPKYYLEHYYLRPKTKQIQFLSELEVTGRPDNTVKERPYSVHNWENLVPGSLEDEIYHGVMKYMQRNNLDNIWPRGKSFRDVLEDTLRISL